jgi:RHS repeat-associated protein
LAFIFSVNVYAAPGLKTNTSQTNTTTGLYQTQIEDIRVKVQGGYLIIARSYKNGEWQWNRRWNPITLIGLDRYDPASLPTKVNRNGALYIPLSGARNVTDFAQMSYSLDSNRKFTMAKDNVNDSYSYSWHNKQGGSIHYAGPLFDADIDVRDYQPKLKIASYSDANGNTITFNRNGLGDIETISMEGETLLTYTYNANRLQFVTDYTGRRVEYHYTDGKLIAVRDVRGEVWHYAYQADTGYLTSYRDPEGFTTTLDVDANGVVSKQSNDNGQQTQTITSYVKSKDQSYRRQTDASGMITETWSNANGQTVRLDINGETRYTIDIVLSDNSTNVRKLNQVENLYIKTRIRTDAQGDKTRTDYDTWGNITKIIYPDGGTETRHYDLRFMLLDRLTDETGVISEYSYDDNGNLIQMVEAKGLPEQRIVQYNYDSHGNQIEIKRLGDDNTQESIESFTYDNYGNLKTQTDGEGNHTQYTEYDVLGNNKSLIDSREKIWSGSFDLVGNLTQEIDPDGRITRYEYDKMGRRIKDISPNNSETTYQYYKNQLSSITEPAIKGTPGEDSPSGYTKQFHYNIIGSLTKITDAAGQERRRTYDDEGRIKELIDGNNNTILYEYKENQLTKVVYPTFSETFHYNYRNKVESTTINSDGKLRKRQSFNDIDNRTLTQTDSMGNNTNYQQDVLGRVIKTIDAEQNQTKYIYDNRDNLIEVIDPEGNSTYFQYDKADQLIAEIKQQNNETTQYRYDNAGNLIVISTPQNGKAQLSYSDAGLVIKTNFYTSEDDSNPEKSVNYTYNINGLLEGYNDGVSSTHYGYDPRNQLIQMTQDFGNFTKIYSYSYYPNGLKKSYVNPEGVEYVYTYDGNGQIQSIDIPNEGKIGYNNYKWSVPTEILYPKGNKQLLEYDDTLRLISRKYQGVDKITWHQTNLSYDNENNILSQNTEHHSIFPQGGIDYDYDKVYRLTDVNTTSKRQDLPLPEDEHYSYDKVSNRISSHATEQQDWLYNDNNQLIQAGIINFTYDLGGNQISRIDTTTNQTTHYIYNSEQRLIRVEDNNHQVIAQYYYDPFGRRLSKTIAGQTTYYLYNQEGLVAEYDQLGNLQTEYHYQPNSTWMANPLFMRTASNDEILYYYNDHLGTPQALHNKGGVLKWLANYSAFGEATVLVNSVTQNLRFPGQYFDVESGLHYNYFRDYDPVLGRYITKDPIGLAGGLNTFAYVAGNPIKRIDPYGLYFPKEWPDNCILTITDDDSSEKLTQLIGSPRLLDRIIIFSGARINKKYKIGYAAILKWEQVTYNFLLKITKIDYYLECTDIDECGNKSTKRHFGWHRDEEHEVLEDTVDRWTEIEWNDADVPKVSKR